MLIYLNIVSKDDQGNSMAIDTELFLNWVESRFGDDYKLKGDEIKLNSIFTDEEDTKYHLWCNCEGGKKKRDNGVFRCWKTDKRGSLISLVMLVDKCSFEEALEILGGANANLRMLEEKLANFWIQKEKEPEKIEAFPENVLRLPPSSHRLTDLDSEDFYRVQGEVYLYNRSLPIEGFLICSEGDYRNRIIIPYYNAMRDLIYFNARYLGKRKETLRYMGPPKEVGIGKEDVVYIPEWPVPGQSIWLTEGEFDAKSIHYAGQQVDEKMYAGAFGGKNLSDMQIELLRPYEITLALDRDAAGEKAVALMAQTLRSLGKGCHYVLPPEGFKDWNEMLQKTSPGILIRFLLRNRRTVDVATLLKMTSR